MRVRRLLAPPLIIHKALHTIAPLRMSCQLPNETVRAAIRTHDKDVSTVSASSAKRLYHRPGDQTGRKNSRKTHDAEENCDNNQIYRVPHRFGTDQPKPDQAHQRAERAGPAYFQSLPQRLSPSPPTIEPIDPECHMPPQRQHERRRKDLNGVMGLKRVQHIEDGLMNGCYIREAETAEQ